MFDRQILFTFNKNQIAQVQSAIEQAERDALLYNESEDTISSLQKRKNGLIKWVKTFKKNPEDFLSRNLTILKNSFRLFCKDKNIHDPFLSVILDSFNISNISLDIEFAQLPSFLKQQSNNYKYNFDSDKQTRHLILVGYLIDLYLTLNTKLDTGPINETDKPHYQNLLKLIKNYLNQLYYYNITSDLLLKDNLQTIFQQFTALHPKSFLIPEEKLEYHRALLRLEDVTRDKEDFFHQQARIIESKIKFNMYVEVNPSYQQATRTLNLVHDYLTTSDANAKANCVHDLIDIAKDSTGSANIAVKLAGALIAFIGGAIALASAIALPSACGLLAPINIFGFLIGSTLMAKGLALCGLFGGAYFAKQGVTLFNKGRDHNVAKAIHKLIDKDNESALSRCLHASFRCLG